MMFHYVSLIWDRSNDEQINAVQALAARLQSAIWRTVVDSGGLRVFCADEGLRSAKCLALDGQSGVVLGTLFKNKGELGAPSKNGSLRAVESKHIIRSGGMALVNEYWGSYVAFLRDEETDRTWVLRSPAGNLPCLMTVVNEVTVIFSYLPDCLALNPPSFSINWMYISGLLFKRQQAQETGLNEVSEVLCGERLEVIRGKISKTICWSPLGVARSEAIEDPGQAVEAVRRTTKGCVHAWAACHERILHYLSGGLDSSIVLACLQDAPTQPTVTCVNEYSPGPSSDERVFARLAAKRAGCELLECRRVSTIKLEQALLGSVSEKPKNYGSRLERYIWDAQMVRAKEATALFGGNRGDEVFYRNNPELSVADYVSRHGLHGRVFDVALSAARLRGLSVWRVLRQGVVAAFLRGYSDPAKATIRQHTLINEKRVMELQSRAPHERQLQLSGKNVPPGKRYHVFTLLNPEGYYSPFGDADDTEHVSPLMSQPLIEICLRIPTYILSSGGWDRAIARRAFVSDVPSEILRRRSKGRVGNNDAEILHYNGGFVREMLLDGFLVKEGLLDRHKIEEALSGRPSGLMKGMAKLFQYVDIETWLRICASNSIRMAS